MFPTPEPTNYDLRFELLGIPVRISVWFWLLAAFLGFDLVERGLNYFVAWLLVVFLSVLVHEFGHAMLARAFGYHPRVLLYQFGGLAMFEPDSKFTRGKAIALSIAGPGAGFFLFGLSLLGSLLLQRFQTGMPVEVYLLLESAFGFSILVNLFWSVFNLLPILPLDGGNVSREICTYFSPYRGLSVAAQIGAVLAGVIAAWFLTQQSFFNAFLMGSLCAQNISIAQSRRW